jgi:hypothetical protein
MHEILGALRESVLISGVSIDYLWSNASKGFQIKMICQLDEYSRKLIQPVLEKFNLKMDLTTGTVLISSL